MPDQEPQSNKYIPIVPKYRVETGGEVPEGRIPTTGRVARMHNIVFVPRVTGYEDFNHSMSISNEQYKIINLRRDTPLRTFQDTFGTRGIRHYVDNPGQLTGDAWSEKPQIYNGPDGKLWIREGHHRIIASRLRGEPSIEVQLHNTYWDD